MSSECNDQHRVLSSARRLGILACAALALAGCHTADADGEPRRERSTYIEGAVALPFDPYLYDPVALAEQYAEVHRHVVSCVAERGGGVYEPPEYVAPPVPRFYGLVRLEDARMSAYRPSAEVVTDEQPSLDESTAAMLYGSPENAVEVLDDVGNVLVKVDPGSCYAEAHSVVQPDWIEVLQIESRLAPRVSSSFQDAEDSLLLGAGWRQWSKCMAREGFEFADPWAPYLSIWPGEEPRDDEIATAVADVECKQETGLLEVWSSAVADAQELLLEEDAEVRSDWRRWLDLHGSRGGS